MLSPEETITVKKLTIMAFVNEVMQYLQTARASQPGRQFLSSRGLRQALPEPKRSQPGSTNFSILLLLKMSFALRYLVIN